MVKNILVYVVFDSILASPFLNIGVIYAIFKFSGITALVKYSLVRFVIYGEKISI